METAVFFFLIIRKRFLFRPSAERLGTAEFPKITHVKPQEKGVRRKLQLNVGTKGEGSSGRVAAVYSVVELCTALNTSLLSAGTGSQQFLRLNAGLIKRSGKK